MNQSLLQYIQIDYSNIVQIMTRYGAREKIEDCISAIVTRLLQKDYGPVENPRQYMSASIQKELMNLRRNNKRYIHYDDLEHIEAVSVYDILEEEQDLAAGVARLRFEIEQLPKMQKQAIQDHLQYGTTKYGVGKRETRKASYRLGLMKLKEAFKVGAPSPS